ncbi:MAG: serine/threonine protein kinase [Alloprevotella sp.]|nr:serine/threonine protein kinase [Alloprevotella sp.]
MAKYVYPLKLGTVLRSKDNLFRITDIIGQGSFGITYRAMMPVTIPGPLGAVRCEVSVAVKEFFMRDLCGREVMGRVGKASNPQLHAYYRERFLEEAHNLAQLRHPGIVRVMDRFETNNTNYYAMEYIEGINLGDFLKAHGQLDEADAIDVICEVGEALAYMHDHRILHLDLKPGNVMRRWDGTLMLIDFGLSKEYKDDAPIKTASMALGTKGYAPIEQGKELRFSPAIDVYALGGVLYKLLTNEAPPPAEQIKQNGFPTYKFEGVCSPAVQMALARAMMPEAADRPQTVAEFLRLLRPDWKPVAVVEGEPPVPAKAATPATPTPQPPADEGTRINVQPNAVAPAGEEATQLRPAATPQSLFTPQKQAPSAEVAEEAGFNKRTLYYILAAIIGLLLLLVVGVYSCGGSEEEAEAPAEVHQVDSLQS